MAMFHALGPAAVKSERFVSQLGLIDEAQLTESADRNVLHRLANHQFAIDVDVGAEHNY